MGAWITYGLGSDNQNLPGFVVLGSGGIPLGGVNVYGNGFLPAIHQGSLIYPGHASPLHNVQPTESDAAQRDRLSFINDLDDGFLGKTLTLEFSGEIRCIECDNKIKKTFMQGYCYPCFIASPKTSECILRPELCRAHEGDARDMKWAEEHCLQDQYVYLSLTSNLKVGVTRHTQIPTRWIDQGAHKAIILAKTPNRYLAGMIEKELSKTISDRTYWRRMLLGEYPQLDLIQEKIKLIKNLSSEYEQFITQDNQEIILDYPPIKVN